jgi:hypothetical protein
LPFQMEFRGRIPPRTRLVFPSHVKNQRVSAICPEGDYSFMRNALRITDARPNVPSAMFPATADWDKAEEEYRNAITTVTAKKAKWRWQFMPPPGKTTGGTGQTRGARLLLWHLSGSLKDSHCCFADNVMGVSCSLWAWAPAVFHRARGVFQIQNPA